MTLAYKVEELLALRDSVSESAVSLDKFADEDVIKEHVLRPSVSANGIGGQPFEKPLPASATPGVACATTNLKKPSPSPSVKRGKAERLLKEHGSPPGLRVTAGGRIVPSDLPPLSSTRFGSNGFKLRGVDPGNAMAAQTQSDVNNNFTPQVHIVGTQAVIRVGDRMYALPTYDPSYAPAYPMPSVLSSSLDTSKQPGVSGIMPTQNTMPSIPVASQASRTQSPFLSLDLPSLEAQWASKKEELRYVEQTEVLQAEREGPVWRNQMIARKKSLILEIDALRKQVTAAKEAEASKGGLGGLGGLGPGSVRNSSLPAAGSTVPTTATAPFLPQFQQSIAPGLYPNIGAPFSVPTPSPFQPLLMCPPYGTAPTQGFPEVAQFGRDNQFFVPPESSTNGAQFSKALTPVVPAPVSPGSAGRRSHAVPIKKPHEEEKKGVAQASVLNPKSPTYEPVTKANGKPDSGQNQAISTPSPAKSSPWCSNEAGSGQFNKQEERAISQKPSLSSIDTTDFFPTNTHEHSSTRIAPNKLSKQSSRENTVIPATPDKPWSTSPWNPPSGDQPSRAILSAQNEATRRLTSWPEAFGKQTSLLKSTSKPPAESGTSSSALRKSSVAQSSTDPDWPPIASKPASHTPSTYQEGYQAGLHHLGLPESAEVLNGFVDGLVAFLKEKCLVERKNRDYPATHFTFNLDQDSSSARSSLRGYLSGATLHDSGISFAENVRSARAHHNPSAAYRQAIYSPKDEDRQAPVTYSLYSEATHDPYGRGQAGSTRQETYERKSPSSINQNSQDQSRSSITQSAAGFPRQVSGNQAGNRIYGTPVSMQRYFPTPTEYAAGICGADMPQFVRPIPRQRLSGLDGAMDDLAGLMVDTHMDQTVSTEATQAAGASTSTASCFKPSSGKGKQAASSPATSNLGNGKESSSPVRAFGSPKKAGEHSPAKARLEQVTNKLRRPRKDDPRTMSPEDKQKRTEKWRGRFRQIKTHEKKEMVEYELANQRKDMEEGIRR